MSIAAGIFAKEALVGKAFKVFKYGKKALEVCCDKVKLSFKKVPKADVNLSGPTTLCSNAPGSGGRLGSPSTRQQIDDIASELERRGWTITGGGGPSRNLKEEYLPGLGGGRKGSSYPDITAEKNGKTLRVNTIDTYTDGVTPTKREAANAARIRAQTCEHLVLIPKQ